MSASETRETGETSASVNESNEDVSRRELVMKLLGAAAGGVALQALTGCVTQTSGSEPPPEDIGEIALAAANQGTAIYWADTVLGTSVAPPGSRNGDLSKTPTELKVGNVTPVMAIAKTCLTGVDGGGG